MHAILKKLRIKFALTTTLVAGIFLLLLLTGVFVLLFASTEISATKTLETALHSPDLTSDTNTTKRCIRFRISGTNVTINDEINFYNADSKQIVETAMSVGNGKFHVAKYSFRVTSRVNSDKSLSYAVYDRSIDRQNLITTAAILAFLYTGAIMLIGLISYLFSSQILKPVQESFQKQRELIANASHELKTPLTIISTNLSVVHSEPLSSVESNEKWLSSIATQVKRMNGLVVNMLELSRMEQSVLSKNILDFSQVVEGACLAFEAVCFEKGIEFISTISPDISIVGDKDALERLIFILFDNAVKYCGEHGKIGCHLKIDKKVYLSVMNTGDSISKEDTERIFDRFYRIDGARTNSDNQSFGLGLAIAQATVVAHDGEIVCHGIEGKGTVFEIYLPLSRKVSEMTLPKNKHNKNK